MAAAVSGALFHCSESRTAKEVNVLSINPLLLPYVPLVEYIGQAFGKTACLVVRKRFEYGEHAFAKSDREFVGSGR